MTNLLNDNAAKGMSNEDDGSANFLHSFGISLR